MPELHVPDDTLALLGLVAAAIRDELGEAIDAYPGHHDPDAAEPINRAYRAISAAVLSRDTADPALVPALVSEALRRLAERRLAADGFTGAEASRLIVDEPGSPDDWLCFLLLSSRRQVADALAPDDPIDP